MITATNLIRELQKLPPDSKLAAYEGEDVGLRVELPDGRTGWIPARAHPADNDFDGPLDINETA